MKTLRIAFYDYYPMANKECKIPTWRVTSRCKMPGLAVEIVKLIVDYLNWKVEVVQLPIKAFDSEQGDYLLNGTVDFHGLVYEQTKKRSELFEFSSALYEGQANLLVRHSESSLSGIFDFFGVYSWQAWLGIGMALIFFTLFGAGARLVEYKLKMRKSIAWNELIWKMIRVQLIQHENFEYRLMAGSFSLLIFTFLQVTIIISLYQSWIISSVVRTKDYFPFHVDELPNLFKERKYRLIVNSYSWIVDEIETNSRSPYYEYRQSMHNDSIKLADTKKELLEIVNRGSSVAVMGEDGELAYMAQDWCDLVQMPSPFPLRSRHLMFRKNNPLLPDINMAIRAQRVLIERAHRKYFTFRAQSKCRTSHSILKPLSLMPYYGVLFLFLIGMVTACFAFGGEMMTRKLINKS